MFSQYTISICRHYESQEQRTVAPKGHSKLKSKFRVSNHFDWGRAQPDTTSQFPTSFRFSIYTLINFWCSASFNVVRKKNNVFHLNLEALMIFNTNVASSIIMDVDQVLSDKTNYMRFFILLGANHAKGVPDLAMNEANP